jgi:hypothetical protein
LNAVKLGGIVAVGVERSAQPLGQPDALGVVVAQALDERRAVGPVAQEAGEDIGFFLGMVTRLGKGLDVIDDRVQQIEAGRSASRLDFPDQVAQAGQYAEDVVVLEPDVRPGCLVVYSGTLFSTTWLNTRRVTGHRATKSPNRSP